jgi:hypothetical protein
MTATARLNTALLTLAVRGERPRCFDPIDHQLWTSEEPADRANATTWCTGCQVLALCHQAADEREENWGVWVAATGRSDQEGMRRDRTAYRTPYWSYLASLFSVRLIRPVFHFFKPPNKRPTCLPKESNAFVVFSFSQNSSGHLSATLIRVFQPKSTSCRANATMTPMM